MFVNLDLEGRRWGDQIQWGGKILDKISVEKKKDFCRKKRKDFFRKRKRSLQGMYSRTEVSKFEKIGKKTFLDFKDPPPAFPLQEFKVNYLRIALVKLKYL